MGSLACRVFFAFDALADMPPEQRQRELSGLEKKDPVLHRLLTALLAADAALHPLDAVSPEELLGKLLTRRSAATSATACPPAAPHAPDE